MVVVVVWVWSAGEAVEKVGVEKKVAILIWTDKIVGKIRGLRLWCENSRTVSGQFGFGVLVHPAV